jgi:hypothetical protein
VRHANRSLYALVPDLVGSQEFFLVLGKGQGGIESQKGPYSIIMPANFFKIWPIFKSKNVEDL